MARAACAERYCVTPVRELNLSAVQLVFGGLGEWFADENRIAWSQGVGVQPTDTSSPDYFHKVVDCQWACPAHTNVPEYIRLIAQGRYDDAYMLNRESNVFPSILGRTCDRPCEPACRRERGDGAPVAICRLKRTNIPAFRLPAEVLDEETQVILDMGVDIRYDTPITSLRALLGEGYDA